jgi:GntR family transcriptional regulator
MPDAPGYLRIASELRRRIVSGDLPPGAKLPSETRLMEQYGVSRTVAKYAIQVLKSEGLVEGRAGSGVYVSELRRLVREAHGRGQRSQGGPSSPFARDAERSGHRGGWEHDSQHDTARPEVAGRLAIEPGDPVMHTRYRFLADGVPIQLSSSWEPLAVTGGTEVEWPEDGAAVGVVARMDFIGVRIDECVERVTSRPARPDEIEALDLSQRGGQVLMIERTYLVAGRPVETADIVLSNRYQLVYQFPID